MASSAYEEALLPDSVVWGTTPALVDGISSMSANEDDACCECEGELCWHCKLGT